MLAIPPMMRIRAIINKTVSSYPRPACLGKLKLDGDVAVAWGTAVGLGSPCSNVLPYGETNPASEFLGGRVVPLRVGDKVTFPEGGPLTPMFDALVPSMLLL